MNAESSNEDIESDGDENPLDILGLVDDSDDYDNGDDDTSGGQEAPGAFWTEDYDEYDVIVDRPATENPLGVVSGKPTENDDHGGPSAEFQAILDEFGFDASENEEEDVNVSESKHGEREDDMLEKNDNGNHLDSNHDLAALGLDDSDDDDDRGSQPGIVAEQAAPPSEEIVGSTDVLAVDNSAPLPKIEEVVEESFVDMSFVASDMHDNYDNSRDAPLNLIADDCNSPERDWNSSVNESNEAALIRRVSQYLSTHEEEWDRKDSTIEPCQDDEVVEPSSIAMHELEGLSDMEAFTRMALGRSTLNLKDLRIQSLEPLCLQTLTGLTTLRLPGNEFHDVNALARSLETLTSLTDLDLSRCQLKELPVLQQVPHLRRFDASQNCLKTSRGILYCTELRQVNLSHNQIRRIEQLETLILLEDLNMAHNRLGPSVLAAMRTVAACSQLRVLHVVGNPISNERAHRVQITDLIPTLELIDDRRVQTLKIPRKAPAINAEKHRSSLDVSSRGKAVSSDQAASMLDTSISYGILAQSSPQRRPLQSSPHHRPVQDKPLRLRVPSQRYSTQKIQAPAPPRKPSESLALARQSAVNRAVTPKRQPKSKQRSKKNITGGSPTKSKESNSPRKPWVVAACLASPPPPTHMHEINGRRIRIRSPFGMKSEASSALLDELKRIDELDAEMESVTGEADAETGSIHNDTQLSLSDLLHEKRRLLQKVSAQLNGGVGTAIENLPLVPPLPSDISISVDRKISRDLSSVDVSDLDGATEDVRCLLASLREGIERKRALLDQLQHV